MVDVRLPGKGSSNSHGARTVAKCVVKTSVAVHCWTRDDPLVVLRAGSVHSFQFENNYFAEMCSGSKAGSYLRLINFVYHSTLGLRVIKKKNMKDLGGHVLDTPDARAPHQHFVVLGAAVRGLRSG